MANRDLQTDLENHNNLGSMWRAIGASPIPGLEHRQGMLCDGWPHRAWLDLGDAPSRDELKAIDRARGSRSILLPLWQAPTAEQEALLLGQGYQLALTQTAMSRELPLARPGQLVRSTVRQVQSSDELHAWVAAVSSAFGYEFAPSVAEHLFQDPLASLFVATAASELGEQEISGTGVVYGDGAVGGVHWMGVVPAHRRRGVARALMTSMLHHLSTRGHRLATLQSSAAGKHLYESQGFGGDTVIQTFRSPEAA